MFPCIQVFLDIFVVCYVFTSLVPCSRHDKQVQKTPVHMDRRLSIGLSVVSGDWKKFAKVSTRLVSPCRMTTELTYVENFTLNRNSHSVVATEAMSQMCRRVVRGKNSRK